MRALVIGRGSMGRRRIRDLTALGVEVESWDITDGKMEERHYKNRALCIVSTPPKTKREYVQWARFTNGFTHCFTEADVEVPAYDPRHDHLPSATPLFTDWWPELREKFDSGTTEGYVLHVGQHIDDWHPGAGPATYYAYKDETSPTREMIPFELIWLTKLFGPVSTVSGQRSFALAHVIVTHYGGVVGHIIIDSTSRPPIRRFDIVGTSGFHDVFHLTYSEETYLRETRAFIAAVKGEQPWPYSQAEEAANLEVLRMIERSG